MRTVLILAPHFPPVSSADMHRVRISVSHFQSYGWRPIVLTVDPKFVYGLLEPALLRTLPANLQVERSLAVPLRLTAPLGLRDTGLRAYLPLFARGARLLRRNRIDLVFVSSTVFHAFSLAALWKRLYGVPFVLDLQDPWGNWLPPSRDDPRAGFKRRVARAVHRFMEAVVVPRADGFMAVSKAYLDELDNRYRGCAGKPRAVLPFGFSPDDFAAIPQESTTGRFFDENDGNVHGVYVGRGGADMARSLRVFFRALARGVELDPQRFSRVKLHFIGTDYACEQRAKESVRPLAEQIGVGKLVFEHPARVSYFQSLSLLKRAQFLMIPGSDDGRYTASKIFPYMLAAKPLLAVFQASSSAARILEDSGAASPVTLDNPAEDGRRALELFEQWHDLMRRPGARSRLEKNFLSKYSPSALTRAQCVLFDSVVDSASGSPVTSTGSIP